MEIPSIEWYSEHRMARILQIKKMSLVEFYGISFMVDYLMPNPVFTY